MDALTLPFQCCQCFLVHYVIDARCYMLCQAAAILYGAIDHVIRSQQYVKVSALATLTVPSLQPKQMSKRSGLLMEDE